MNDASAQPVNPFMTDAFARVYEETGERITGQASRAALKHVGNIEPDDRILDIAAGTGALTIPAAESGANITAIDIAPGMVRRLASKIESFPNAEALEMDGARMDFSDGAFDLTFSVFGVIVFMDWRKGLSEQCRVTRPGGRGCVVTWRDPSGGGPFQIMAASIGRALPDRPPAFKPEAFVRLSEPAHLIAEMEAAGFQDVLVEEIECYWEGPAGEAYLEQLRALHSYMPPYVMLSPEDKLLVDEEVVRLSQSKAVDGKLRLPSRVLIAVGTKADATPRQSTVL